VLETFISLLHLTWLSLDTSHDLTGKFRFNSESFLMEVLARMGSQASIDDILASSLGGHFEARRKDPSP
jgi:hypothetical protein